MELLKFEDTCIISRVGDSVNEWGDQSETVIYNGACSYQESSTRFAYPVEIHTAMIYLPSNSVEIRSNDKISITTYKGRTRTAYVQNVRDIRLPLHLSELTKITLKDTL